MDVIKVEYGSGTVRIVQSASPLPVRSGSGANYTETFSSPTATWIVNHNLGYEPSITVLTMGGLEIEAQVHYTSLNQCLVSFNTPTSGRILAS